MLCLPGFLPVTEEANAGGVRGGIVDISVPVPPSAARRAKFGRRPSAIIGSRTRKLPPSIPTATTFRAGESDCTLIESFGNQPQRSQRPRRIGKTLCGLCDLCGENSSFYSFT